MRIRTPKKDAVYITMVGAKSRKTVCTTVYETTPVKAMEQFKRSVASKYSTTDHPSPATAIPSVRGESAA